MLGDSVNVGGVWFVFVVVFGVRGGATGGGGVEGVEVGDGGVGVYGEENVAAVGVDALGLGEEGAGGGWGERREGWNTN